MVVGDCIRWSRTEANNAALKGVYFKHTSTTGAPHIITTAIEHPAVLAPCKFLQSLGAHVTQLPVDSAGLVDPDRLQSNEVNTDTRLNRTLWPSKSVKALKTTCVGLSSVRSVGARERHQGCIWPRTRRNDHELTT